MGREVPKIVNTCLDKLRHFKRKVDGETYHKWAVVSQRRTRDFVLFLVPDGSGVRQDR